MEKFSDLLYDKWTNGKFDSKMVVSVLLSTVLDRAGVPEKALLTHHGHLSGVNT